MLKAHNHAFWVFGVIVGLAIREALTRVMPHAVPLIAQAAALPSLPPVSQAAQDALQAAAALPLHHRTLEVIRLITFLAMIIRFYLGAAIYFDEAYLDATAEQMYPQPKNYGVDFLSGLIQFIFFFAWSETLIGHERFAHGLSAFLVLLGIILFYDTLWWILSAKYSTKVRIRVWAVLNGATLIVAYAVLLFLHDFGWFTDCTNEVAALVPVGLMTIFDFGEMFGGTNLVTAATVRVLKGVGVRS
jgi:hypothetical protein